MGKEMFRYGVLAASLALATIASPAAAQLASRTTAEWLETLESPGRIQGLKVAETVKALGLQPGQVVADIGAGAGAFEAALSEAVGPRGRVYAEDVDKGLVDAVAKRAAQFGLTNVTTVLGGFTDPKLPANNVDLAFIYDVLHHVEQRPAFLLALSKYIKPGGRIALVEFKPGVAGHRDRPDLQVSMEDANTWMAAAGFRPVQTIDLFPDKYFVIYARR